MMPSLPLAILLIPYALFVLVYLFFLAFHLYHLRAFGIKGAISHGLGTIFLVGTVIILGASWIVLSRYDWKQPMNLEEASRPFTDTNVFNPYDRSRPTP